jgi:hypothetical protein
MIGLVHGEHREFESDPENQNDLSRASDGAVFSAGRTGRILQTMADPSPPVPYEVKTRRCTIHAGRYRWDIWAHGKRVQSSTDSFASREEATAAGHAELERLGKTLRTGE